MRMWGGGGGGGGGGCAGVVGGWRRGCARCGGDLEAGRRDCSLAGMAAGRAVFGAKGDGKKRFCGDSGREDGGGVFGVARRMVGGTETLWKRDVLGSWGLGHRLDGIGVCRGEGGALTCGSCRGVGLLEYAVMR